MLNMWWVFLSLQLPHVYGWGALCVVKGRHWYYLWCSHECVCFLTSSCSLATPVVKGLISTLNLPPTMSVLSAPVMVGLGLFCFNPHLFSTLPHPYRLLIGSDSLPGGDLQSPTTLPLPWLLGELPDVVRRCCAADVVIAVLSALVTNCLDGVTWGPPHTSTTPPIEVLLTNIYISGITHTLSPSPSEAADSLPNPSSPIIEAGDSLVVLATYLSEAGDSLEESASSNSEAGDTLEVPVTPSSEAGEAGDTLVVPATPSSDLLTILAPFTIEVDAPVAAVAIPSSEAGDSLVFQKKNR